jgi:hypothetical protein
MFLLGLLVALFGVTVALFFQARGADNDRTSLEVELLEKQQEEAQAQAKVKALQDELVGAPGPGGAAAMGWGAQLRCRGV